VDGAATETIPLSVNLLDDGANHHVQLQLGQHPRRRVATVPRSRRRKSPVPPDAEVELNSLALLCFATIHEKSRINRMGIPTRRR
jgi:hypothetical protein